MRLLGLGLLLLGGYYARFYLERGDPVTLLQLGILLAASTLLLFSRGLPARWRPSGWREWLVVLAGLLLAAAFVAALDRDSHSVSDTLNRVVPMLCLWLALGLRLRADSGDRLRSDAADLVG